MDDTNGGGLFGNVAGWFAHPFNSQGSAISWVLFVGLVIIAVFLWQLILLMLTKEV